MVDIILAKGRLCSEFNGAFNLKAFSLHMLLDHSSPVTAASHTISEGICGGF
jgi:hypothetical protein